MSASPVIGGLALNGAPAIAIWFLLVVATAAFIWACIYTWRRR